ncbi:MAG: TIGR04211 family SH3 domain-containing protein [Candidatus Contendobacter sp.]|jgi:SH3 domain protein|nr:TIGR04211 family SH3 domain-containing protein [Gammaproteobacteria bacterium]MCC8994964.1 TIGR04211 family SH3 domain-containing protein [Candidatus Contendobacter sp.]
MKILLTLFLMTFLLSTAAQTPPKPQSRTQVQTPPKPQPQSQTQAPPQPKPAQVQPKPAIYASDTLDLPLRAGASDRYKIIGMVQSGSPVEVLIIDNAKGYTQIRTPKGIKGWLPSNQLTEIPSGRVLLAKVRQELEQLQARHAELKQHINEMVNTPQGEALSYPQLYEEAVRLRQQLAEYRKVAADTVAIDERNKALQEQTVTLERELQVVQQENQAMRNENDSMKLLLGAVLAGAVVLAALLIPRILEQRREQWSRL